MRSNDISGRVKGILLLMLFAIILLSLFAASGCAKKPSAGGPTFYEFFDPT
jgi:hypothetical protein